MTERDGRPFSSEEFSQLRGNSFFQEELLPYLDDRALAIFAEHCRRQTGSSGRFHAPSIAACSSYEDALLFRVLPEMIRRLKAKPSGETDTAEVKSETA